MFFLYSWLFPQKYKFCGKIGSCVVLGKGFDHHTLRVALAIFPSSINHIFSEFPFGSHHVKDVDVVSITAIKDAAWPNDDFLIPAMQYQYQ